MLVRLMGQPIARGRWPLFDEQVAELLHAVDTLLRLSHVHTPKVQRERAVGPLLRLKFELVVRVREIVVRDFVEAYALHARRMENLPRGTGPRI